MDKAEKAQMDEVIKGLPPDLVARLGPVMATGSMRSLLPVLKHIHGQLGEFIEKMEIKYRDSGADSGKGRQ